MNDILLSTSSGTVVEHPDRLAVQVFVTALPRGNHLVLAHEGASGPNQHFLQVMHLPEGRYQVEYRAGSPQEHYQAFTDAPAAVIDAMSGWIAGDDAWRSQFEWTSIGDWFE